MAGAGFKDFAVGEVLTASDVDTYLMQQSVMRFADAAARGTALGTAVGAGTALAEGMVSYLDDANVMQVYDGSGWTSPMAGIGSNVVQAIKTDTFSTTATSYTNVTGLSATITPTSNTSKVLIIAQISVGGSSSNQSGLFRISGGNATTYVGDTAGNRTRSVFGGIVVTGAAAVGAFSMVYLDSPATTSATTYTVQAMRGSVSAGTVRINFAEDDADDNNRSRGASSLTVIEVAA